MLLKLISIFYYLLFAITPFLMSAQTSEMFEFNKMMFIYASAIIITFLWGIYFVFNRPKLKLNIFVFAFLGFLITQLLSFIFSIDKHTSFYGVYSRWNGGILSVISYGVLFFVFFQIISATVVMRILQLSLIVSSLVVLWGLPAKFGGDLSCLYFTGELTNSCWTAQFQPAVRMFSTLGQPNWLGAYLAIHFFLGATFLTKLIFKDNSELNFISKVKALFSGEDKFKAFFYLISSLVSFIGVLFTGSRSSLLSILISLFIGAILYKTAKLKKAKKNIVRALSITSLLIFSLIAISAGSLYQAQKVPKHLQITDSFAIRTIVWEGAIKLFLKNPVLGTGPETFGISYFFVKPEAHNRTSEWDFIYNKAHNEFLHILATMGIIGFVGYLFLVGVGIYLLSRKIESHSVCKKIYSYGFLLAYLSILITNFFGFSTSTVQIMFYMLPVMFLILASEEKGAEKLKIKWNLNKALAISGLILVTFFLLTNLMKYIMADRLYKKGLSAEASNDIITASSFYARAVKERYEPVYYDKLSGALAQVAFVQSFSADKKEFQELVQSSVSAQDIALSCSPKNILFWRTKAKNYYFYFQVTRNFSDLKKAVDAMTYTAILAPTDAQSQYMTGIFYTILKDETGDAQYGIKAKEYLDRANELRPGIE